MAAVMFRSKCPLAGIGEAAEKIRAQFRQPLGVSVIGGVITSTLLTLLVIPTVYEIFADGRGALARRFGRGRRGHEPAPGLAPAEQG